jgi:AraC-like DNA-binding protein
MPAPKRIESFEPPWLLPSGAPIAKRGLFTLSQPVLRRCCLSRGFTFFDATLLLICSGRLILDDTGEMTEASDAASVIVVPKDTRLDVIKSPDSADGIYRSVFLAFSPQVIGAFHRLHVPTEFASGLAPKPRRMPLDDSFADTLSYCLRGLSATDLSDRECEHRLVGVLIALADRGWQFTRPGPQSVADQLRDVLRNDPSRSWTTAEAGNVLAMSEATLRRRLAKEGLRFEEILTDIRMHHAMALLQTTCWSIPQVARACGYQTRTRFAARFRKRFGCSPSEAR